MLATLEHGLGQQTTHVIREHVHIRMCKHGEGWFTSWAVWLQCYTKQGHILGASVNIYDAEEWFTLSAIWWHLTQSRATSWGQV